MLLPGAWRIARGRAAGRLFGWVLAAVALGGVLALFLNWMPVLPQRNMPWICLLLPLHAAFWLTLSRRPTPPQERQRVPTGRPSGAGSGR